MATTPRNIRFDDDLYKEMKAIAKYPLSAAYHIQEACREYLADRDKPVKASKVEFAERPVLTEAVASITDFDLFWQSGIRKANKKKAKSLFNNLLKGQNDPGKFTGRLIVDVQKRLAANQRGFAEMHPTTYLNGERWNDEVITNEDSKRSNQQLSTRDQQRNSLERDMQAIRKLGSSPRRHDSQPVLEHDKVLLEQVDETVGGDDGQGRESYPELS